ncbi:flagellar hook assembly protein FlgD [Fundidesulfovibrio terrae]|uniref:flagellar hook assembly protein FlgD n=1 Tax=Fundidesulfovibrio terrae TaxID=2922866 RepID=UPI001FAF8949|nr:flagellar hook capping FlgD N-terminal domain-containing protein [Fundidesulfovibrio terrae]
MSSVYTDPATGATTQLGAMSQLTPSSGKSSLGSSDFLTLLFAQLQNQDPLNPQDDKDFTAQLAQFSSLEQLTNLNSGMGKLITATNQQQMFSAVGFMGKQVTASGSTLAKSGGSVSALYYTLPAAASSVTVNIMDANGNIIRSVSQGAQAAGSQSFQWDGKDSNGNLVPDGTYSTGVTTLGSDGKPLMVTTSVTGLVTGVSSDSTTGSYMLTTQDGRKINLMDVQGVVTPTTSS